jgi:hypothetical protein
VWGKKVRNRACKADAQAVADACDGGVRFYPQVQHDLAIHYGFRVNLVFLASVIGKRCHRLHHDKRLKCRMQDGAFAAVEAVAVPLEAVAVAVPLATAAAAAAETLLTVATQSTRIDLSDMPELIKIETMPPPPSLCELASTPTRKRAAQHALVDAICKKSR